MKEIDDLTKLIICLVPIGCIARIVALLIKMSCSDRITSYNVCYTKLLRMLLHQKQEEVSILLLLQRYHFGLIESYITL